MTRTTDMRGDLIGQGHQVALDGCSSHHLQGAVEWLLWRPHCNLIPLHPFPAGRLERSNRLVGWRLTAQLDHIGIACHKEVTDLIGIWLGTVLTCKEVILASWQNSFSLFYIIQGWWSTTAFAFSSTTALLWNFEIFGVLQYWLDDILLPTELNVLQQNTHHRSRPLPQAFIRSAAVKLQEVSGRKESMMATEYGPPLRC